MSPSLIDLAGKDDLSLLEEEEATLLKRAQRPPHATADAIMAKKKTTSRMVGAVAVLTLAFASVSLSWGEAPLDDAEFASTNLLSVTTSNEYGELPAHTKKVYGFFDHIVEPGKTTTFAVNNGRDGETTYTWGLEYYDSDSKTHKQLHKTVGETMEFQFDYPSNEWFRVTLKEELAGADAKTFVTDKVVSKYVRREIRGLNDADREAIFSAMEVMYNTELEEGRALYGDNFKSGAYMAAIHSATQNFCYHWGDMFITSHPAFQLWFEQSIRAIDSNISTSFYWDFMLDDALYEDTWFKNSTIYKDSWFGSTTGSADSEFKVTTGRFADTSVPTHGPDYPFGIALYNSYGSIGQVCDNSNSEIIQRSTSFCGLETSQRLASSDDMIGCFMNNSKLRDWDLCLEINVHGNLHSLHGGAWDCYSDLSELSTANPTTYPKKLMDFIGVSAFNLWFKEMQGDDNTYDCTTQKTLKVMSGGWPCDRDDSACAEVVHNVDFSSSGNVSDAELYLGFANVPLEFMYETQRGKGFLEPIDESVDIELHTLGAWYKWSHLPVDEQIAFTRWLMIFGSTPGKTGIASTGAAPADPLFWAWHAVFDKMLHVLRLSPHFKEKYDMTWVATSEDMTDCGSHWLDHMPFENIFDDAPKDTKFTNKQLWELLEPTEGHLPYIYEQFTTWGAAEWDPLKLR